MSDNYKIEGILILLNEDCILYRYYPLISIKEDLLKFLKKHKVEYKEDCKNISDADLIKSGLLDLKSVKLFRAFLAMYDFKPAKEREVDKLDILEKEKKIYKELYMLPGVKETRASLYIKAGIKSLKTLSKEKVDNIILKCNKAIELDALNLKAPLPKEVKTHIAVAKAFTL